MGLRGRFVLALASAVLFPAFCAIALWAHDHNLRRDAARSAHAALVLNDMVVTLETRLLLGLPLAQLPEVDRLLDAARHQLPVACSLAVVDERGKALFSTDPVDVGDVIFEIEKTGELTSGRRRLEDDEVFWRVVVTEYGTVAGVVVARLPAAVAHEKVVTFALSLLVRVMPIIALLIVLAILAGFLLARRVEQSTKRTVQVLTALREPPSMPLAAVDESSTNDALIAFVKVVRERHQLLAEGEADLVRLDEMA